MSGYMEVGGGGGVGSVGIYGSGGGGVGSVGIYGSVCYLKAICRHCHRERFYPYTRLHACHSHSPNQWFDIMVLRTAWLSKVWQKFCLACGA